MIMMNSMAAEFSVEAAIINSNTMALFKGLAIMLGSLEILTGVMLEAD